MRALVLFAFLGSALAWDPTSVNRIVGGSATTIETYPFMSNMEFGWFGVSFSQSCGGALITQNAILSAAHCFDGWPAAWWRVRLGSTLRTSGGIIYNINRIIIHEQYDILPLDADVAIVRLQTNAVLSNTIKLARISGPNYHLADHTTITAIGYGHLQSGGPSPRELQHVDFDVINQEICAQRYAELKQQPGFQNWPDITPGMLCSGILDVGGKDACQGDSGGPVVHDGNVVVGVVSWGRGCAMAYYPGVLARVSYYSNWIVSNAS